MPAYVYAGAWGPFPLLDTNGNPVTTAKLYVYNDSGHTTLSSLYTDYTKSVASANPVVADGLGNYTITATPGVYYCIASFNNANTDMVISVEPYPLDTALNSVTALSAADSTITVNNANPLTPTVKANVGTTSGTVAAGNDPRFAAALQSANNLTDLASLSAAQTTLGLEGAAYLNVGTSAGTVAAGNDSRFGGVGGVPVSGTPTSGQVPVASSPTAAAWGALTAGEVSGLGGAAVLNVGITGGTVAAGNDSRFANMEGQPVYTPVSPLSATDSIVKNRRHATPKKFVHPSIGITDTTDMTLAATNGFDFIMVNGGNMGFTNGGQGMAAWVPNSPGTSLATQTVTDLNTMITNMEGVSTAGNVDGGLSMYFDAGTQNFPTWPLTGNLYTDQVGNTIAYNHYTGQVIANIWSAAARTAKDNYLSLIGAKLQSLGLPKTMMTAGDIMYGEARLPLAQDAGGGSIAVTGTVTLGTTNGFTTANSCPLSSAAPASWGTTGIAKVGLHNYIWYSGLSGTQMNHVGWLSNGTGTSNNPSVTPQSFWGFDSVAQSGGADLPSHQVAVSSVIGDGALNLVGYLPFVGYLPGTTHNSGGTTPTGQSANNDLLWVRWYLGSIAREIIRDLYVIRQSGFTGPIYIKHNGSSMLQWSPTISTNLPTIPASASITNGTYGGNTFDEFMSALIEGVDHDLMMGVYGKNAGTGYYATLVNSVLTAMGSSQTAGAFPFGDVRPDFSGADVYGTGGGARITQGAWAAIVADYHGVRNGCMGENSGVTNWAANFDTGGYVNLVDYVFPAVQTAPGSASYNTIAYNIQQYKSAVNNSGTVVISSGPHSMAQGEQTVVTSGSLNVILPPVVVNGDVGVWNPGSGTVALYQEAATVATATGTLAITSIATTYVAQAIASGSTITLISGATTQNFVTSSLTAVGAVSILVNSLAPSINFQPGTVIAVAAPTATLLTLTGSAFTSDGLNWYATAGTGGGGSSTVHYWQLYTTTGANTWPCPAGVLEATVTCCAGGGGGASGGVANTTSTTVGMGGGGGGAGSVAVAKVATTPLSSYTATVGLGGTAGASVSTTGSNGNNGNQGGTSSFALSGTTYVQAAGGGGGAHGGGGAASGTTTGGGLQGVGSTSTGGPFASGGGVAQFESGGVLGGGPLYMAGAGGGGGGSSAPGGTTGGGGGGGGAGSLTGGGGGGYLVSGNGTAGAAGTGNGYTQGTGTGNLAQSNATAPTAGAAGSAGAGGAGGVGAPATGAGGGGGGGGAYNATPFASGAGGAGGTGWILIEWWL